MIRRLYISKILNTCTILTYNVHHWRTLFLLTSVVFTKIVFRGFNLLKLKVCKPVWSYYLITESNTEMLIVMIYLIFDIKYLILYMKTWFQYIWNTWFDTCFWSIDQSCPFQPSPNLRHTNKNDVVLCHKYGVKNENFVVLNYCS